MYKICLMQLWLLGSNIVYSVSSGADFTIGNTGILSFKVAPDYEVVGQREYNVVVTVSSGSSVGNATIRVLVEDLNDNSPTGLNVLDGDGMEVGSIVVDEGDISVLGTLMGVDVDTVGMLTYTIADARFSIEEVSVLSDTHQILRATDSLDFEGSEVTNGTTILQVTVSDGVNDGFVKSLTITVRDEDDEAPENLRLVDNGGVAIVNPVGEENGVNVVGTLTADDADTTAGNLVYSTGDSRFMVDGRVLKTRASLDYEDDTKVVGGETTVLLTVEDGGDNSAVISLVVTVTDRDDEAPENLRLVDSGGVGLINPVGDEAGDGVIGTLMAMDVDTADGDLVYSVGDGRFSVDGNVLRTDESLDFESLTGRLHGTAIVEVVVTVSDGDSPPNSLIESFMITINDVNESPVVDRVLTIQTILSENRGGSVDGVIARLFASDPEGDGLSYSVDNDNFVVNNIGELSSKVGGLDYESLSGSGVGGTAIVEVKVTVSDGNVNTDDISESFMVTINDVDESPVLESTEIVKISLEENAEGFGGSSISLVTFSVRDPEGATIEYSVGHSDFLMGVSGGEGELQARSGVLDYESIANRGGGMGIVEVVVTISDGNNEIMESVFVTVNDVNEKPVIESSTTPRLFLSENVDVPIVTISASDPEVQSIIYRVSGSDFRISNDGILRTKVGGLDYESLSNSGFGGTAIVEVVVTISDGHTPNDIMESFMVTIDDDDELPVLNSTTTPQVVFDEGRDGVISTLRASDPEGLPISYSVNNDRVEINDDGVLSVKLNGFDYESMSGRSGGTATVEVVVTISAGGDTITQSFMLTINDVVNENALPSFNTISHLTIAENAVSGGTALGTVTATDADGDTVSYIVDDERFSVDAGNGKLYLVEEQNYEELGSDKYLTVTVTAVDGRGGSARQEVRVSITDAEDAPMLFTDFVIPENEARTITLAFDDDTDVSHGSLLYNDRTALGGYSAPRLSGGKILLDVPAFDYENPINGNKDNVYLATLEYRFVGQEYDAESPFRITITDVEDTETIAGLGFNRGDLSSWHDASVSESLVDSDGYVIRARNTPVYRWLDLSGNDNHLEQSDPYKRAFYDDGSLVYVLGGGSHYDYNTAVQATSSTPLTTFSVLKIKEIPETSDANFLFGSNDKHGYHGGRNGKIFNHHSRIAELQVDGRASDLSEGTNDEWKLNRRQIIYTRSEKDAEVKISTLSQDRSNTDRSIRGEVNEVIVIKRELTDAQEVVINNHLAAKWGVGTGNADFYAGDTRGGYKYDVTGLVKLADSEVVRTREMGGLRLVNKGMVSDEGDKFFVGHNGEADLNSRVWYADSTASGGKVKLEFSVDELGLTEGAVYLLYYHDFSDLNFNLRNNEQLVARRGEYLSFEIGTGDKLFRLAASGENLQPILTIKEFSLEENSTSVGILKVFDFWNPSGANYTLGGSDASYFSLSGDLTNQRNLSFNSAPDYENARDVDGNNVYELVVTVDDGQGESNSVSSASVQVRVKDVGEHTIHRAGSEIPVYVAERGKTNVFKISNANMNANLGVIEGIDFERGDKIDVSSINLNDQVLTTSNYFANFNGTSQDIVASSNDPSASGHRDIARGVGSYAIDNGDYILYMNNDDDDNIEIIIGLPGITEDDWDSSSASDYFIF